MNRQDLHTHSVYDDGHCTLREMAEGALAAGIRSIGFSCHSPLPFENDWSVPQSELSRFHAEAEEVRGDFAGRLEILIGTEHDLLSPHDAYPYDYIIGSIHHMVVDGAVLSVDEGAEVTAAWLSRYFSGDAKEACRTYYGQYLQLAADPKVDIVGHFDLITKFDEDASVFPAMPGCAAEAMEALVAAGKIFEINTGAVYRGYRKTAYPRMELLKLLCSMGGRICISSDAHNREAVCFQFAEAEALAKAAGFREVLQYRGKGFVPVPLEEETKTGV